jgi:pyruvate formate lyase activating enzyme
MREAMLYERLDENRVRCNLCSHRCVISEGDLGVCRVRKNQGGTLYSLVYGKTISQHVDPIEKKPLYHYLPGSRSYSIATPGCNFHCRWCQNWDIVDMSMRDFDLFGRGTSPERIVDAALRSGSRSIAYTYTEPTIFFEYAYDTAKLARQEGIGNVYVTNGYMTPEMLDAFHPYLDAANVDLKSFREETYHRYVGASLKPILENLEKMKDMGIWVEVTTLVVPDLNDDPDELRDTAQFIVDALGPETPWHISRFFPHRQVTDRPPTPMATLHEAMEIGVEEGLHHIYIGNVADETNTHCPACDRLLVRRRGFGIFENHIQDGCCQYCGAEVAGVWA